MIDLRKFYSYFLSVSAFIAIPKTSIAQDADLQPATDTANFVKDFITGELAVSIAIIGLVWLVLEKRNNTLNGYKFFGYLIVLVVLFGAEEIIGIFQNVIQG